MTVEDIKNWLHKAKVEHTKLYGNDPTHDWETFYAESIYDSYLYEKNRQIAGEIGLRAFKRKSAENQMDEISINYAISGERKTIHDFSHDGIKK